MHKTRSRNTLCLLMFAFVASACGGSDKKSETPSGDVYEEEEEVSEEDEDDGLIPEEKFDEIKNTFERKATTVARCFPDAVAAGEVDSNARIKLTVGVVITTDGRPSKLKILSTSQRSEALEACVLTAVGRWEFTTLPKPVQYSHGFVLQRF